MSEHCFLWLYSVQWWYLLSASQVVVNAGALQGQGPLHHQPGIPLSAHSKHSLVLSALWSVLCATCCLQCAAGYVLGAVFCVLCDVCSVEFAVWSTYVLLSRVLVRVVATAHVDHSHFQLPHPQPLVLTRENRVITNIWTRYYLV